MPQHSYPLYIIKSKYTLTHCKASQCLLQHYCQILLTAMACFTHAKENWPPLILQERKTEVLDCFKKATSSIALCHSTYAACGQYLSVIETMAVSCKILNLYPLRYPGCKASISISIQPKYPQPDSSLSNNINSCSTSDFINASIYNNDCPVILNFRYQYSSLTQLAQKHLEHILLDPDMIIKGPDNKLNLCLCNMCLKSLSKAVLHVLKNTVKQLEEVPKC